MKRIALFLTCLFAVVSLATAQSTKVTGTVLSAEDGEPIPGASVLVEGTRTGGVTNAEGKFSITVPTSAKRLQVSCAGMISQLVKVKPNITVTLETDDKALDEVMIVAYGTATKSSFTGSASIVGTENIEALQSSNVLDALTGHVAGVELYNATGDPTNNTPSIRIRGISSISAGTSPLYIVDGAPYGGDMNTINTQDVESMTVLKDAAATALYGARAANGVIIITTKKGKAGAGAKVTLDAKWGSNSREQLQYKTVSSPAQYYEMYYSALNNYAQNSGMSAAAANIWANNNLTSSNSYGLGMNIYNVPEGQLMIGTNGKLNPSATLGNVVNYNGKDYTLTNDNWLNAAYKHSLRQEYNVNVSNATDKSNFMASFGYTNNEGITYNSSMETLNGRLKADLQAKPWLKVGANMSYSHYNAKSMLADGSSSSSANIFAIATQVAPIYPLYMRDGQGNIMIDSYGMKMYDYGDGRNAGTARPYLGQSNAVQQQMIDVYQWEGNAASANGFAEIRFAKDFTLFSNNTMNLDEYRTTDVTNPYYGSYSSSNGIVSKAHGRSWNYSFLQQLNWHHVYGQHEVDASVGHEWYMSRAYSLSASKSNMFDPNNYELAGAVTDGSNSGSSTSSYNTEGYFIRGQYNYAQKYFLSGSFRRDASSRFAKENHNRWGNFWSAGASWVLSQEEFLKDVSWLNFLKYKISYGEVGNDRISDFLYTNRYTVGNSGGNIAVTPSATKGNPDITWETIGEMNTGIEFNLFKNRLNGGIEYFWRKTSDMLYYFSMATSSGFNGYYDNVGDMVNHGVEVELDADIIRMKNFTWNVGVNLTHYKNKIKSMPEEKKTATALNYDGKEYSGYATGNMFIGEGLSLGSYYMPIYAGVDKETGESLWWKDVETNVTDEDGNYVLNEDGSVKTKIVKETTNNYSDASDYVVSNLLPKIYGGFNTRLEFYGVDITADFAYQIGGKCYDSQYANFMSSPTSSSKGTNFHADLLNAWTPENTETDVPRLQFNDQYSSGMSTRFLTKASYLSLQNLSLGYTLPTRLTHKAKIDRVRVYMNATNVFLWSKRQGLDPRTAATSLTYGTASSSYYSMVRTISAGINVTF